MAFELRIMKRYLFIPILILTFCVGTFPQTNKNSPCPIISLTSDDSNAGAGEYISYTISLSGEFNKYDVKFEWTVKDGEIISGQGTSTIKIKMNLDSLAVEVKIKGLPPNCSDNVSESFVIDRPYPRKVDEFSTSTSQIDKARLDNLILEIQNNPSIVAYIFE